MASFSGSGESARLLSVVLVAGCAALAACAESVPSLGDGGEDTGTSRPGVDVSDPGDDEDTEGPDPGEDAGEGPDADPVDGGTPDGETPDAGPLDSGTPDVPSGGDTEVDGGSPADVDAGGDDTATGTDADGGTGTDGGGDTGTGADAGPCPVIPVCSLAATRCTGDVLETCGRDARGCAAWTSKDCSVEFTGGTCDDSGIPAVCVEPPGLCDDVTTPCTTAATSCSANVLVSCAPRADGCLVETRTNCTTAGDVCVAGPPAACADPVCGDGRIDGAEACDDDDTDAGDGCSSTCTIEDGYLCTGTPSVCETVLCGNGTVDAGEECDDRNLDADDGCSAECLRETGLTSCVGGVQGWLSCGTPLTPGVNGAGGGSYNSYSCSALNYRDDENIFGFRSAERVFVGTELIVAPTDALDSLDILVMKTGASGTCGPDMTCAGYSDDFGAEDAAGFIAEPGDAYAIVVDSTSNTEATPFELGIVCAPVCGDGSADSPACSTVPELLPGEFVVFDGRLQNSDLQYTRPSSTCGTGFSTVRYDRFEVTNPGATPLAVLILANWSFDGWLVAYNGFTPTAPTANCLASNDDSTTTSSSEIEVTIPAGATLTIVATQFGTGDTGPYQIGVFAAGP